MSEQSCPNCNKLFKHNDVVKAVVLSHYVALKSQRHYAIERPFECLEMAHQNCNWPEGMPEE